MQLWVDPEARFPRRCTGTTREFLAAHPDAEWDEFAREASISLPVGLREEGDIVTVAFGKPRPAAVVQSDHLLPYPMVVVVPFTSEIDARPPPFTRLTLARRRSTACVASPGS